MQTRAQNMEESCQLENLVMVLFLSPIVINNVLVQGFHLTKCALKYLPIVFIFKRKYFTVCGKIAYVGVYL